MTREAVDTSMRASKREFCQGVVIKLPKWPAIGVMTAFTSQTQLLFVNVLRMMTVITVVGCALEFGIDMTFLAGGHCMHAD